MLYQGKYAEAKSVFDAVLSSGQFSLVGNYEDIYDPSLKSANTESVFVVHHSVGDGANNDANGDYGSVLSYIQGGPGGCCGFFTPSQDIVNAHKTSNGLPILPSTDGVANHNDIPIDSDYGIFSSQPFTPYSGMVDPRLDWNIGRRGIPFKDWGVYTLVPIGQEIRLRRVTILKRNDLFDKTKALLLVVVDGESRPQLLIIMLSVL